MPSAAAPAVKPSEVVSQPVAAVYVNASVDSGPVMIGAATAPAPVPVSLIVNVGGLVNPEPPFVTGID